MAEIRINATGGVKLYDADDSHYCQIVAGTISANVDILTLNSAGVTVADGAIDFDIASHDTSNGLKLGGTLVTATAAELNIMDGVTSTAAELNIMDGVGATASEINLIDGSAKSTSSITVVDADAFIIIDGTTTKQIPASDIKTYAGGAVSAINNATANELVTIGSTTTELDAESTLTFDGSALVVGGTNPSITIGDAGTEDTKLVFDGNAQDYYIGLDDTDDDFKIGLGSAVGTTAHMVFDEAGAITKPLQPAFLVTMAAGDKIHDMSIDSTVVVGYSTEKFDQNGDYSTPTFTAPVTGRYQLSSAQEFDQVDIGATYYYISIITSNNNFHRYFPSAGFDVDVVYYTPALSILADMDEGDTAHVSCYQSGGTKETDVAVEAFFSGVLVC